MFGRVLNTPQPINLLYFVECPKRNFPPLGLCKGILDSPYLLIFLINTKSKKMANLRLTPRAPFFE